MSFHTDEQFLAAVAAALGETIALCGAAGFTSSRRAPTAIRGPLTHARGTDAWRMTTSSICRRTASIGTPATIHVCVGGPAE